MRLGLAICSVLFAQAQEPTTIHPDCIYIKNRQDYVYLTPSKFKAPAKHTDVKEAVRSKIFTRLEDIKNDQEIKVLYVWILEEPEEHIYLKNGNYIGFQKSLWAFRNNLLEFNILNSVLYDSTGSLIENFDYGAMSSDFKFVVPGSVMDSAAKALTYLMSETEKSKAHRRGKAMRSSGKTNP